MPKQRRSESKIREILAEQVNGASVSGLVKKHGISSATFYNWKAKYRVGAAATPKRGRTAGSKNAPRAVQAVSASATSGASENQRLKVMIVNLMLERDQLQSQLARR